MGASKYWLQRKTSKAEKGNQRNKSRNVKGNSSGTSSASTHLRAPDGSCVDVCTCKKGHFSPLKAWKPERITSPSDTQKYLGSEVLFQKLKNSIIQLKPSLNGRTKSSQQDIKGTTPALKNTSSAVKLRPSLDLNRSSEPPGITKTEIPLLSKKFQVINYYPSDIRIFKYNESVISSPNSSQGSTGQLVAGSLFLSPTSSISLYSTTKTDSPSIKPFERGVVSPFRRKFSTGGLFSAAQNHKKGKAESKKFLDEKEQVSVKNLDIVDYPIEDDILKQVRNDSITKVFPSSSPLSKLEHTFDIDETKFLIVDDPVAEQRLDSMQTDIRSDIPPSIYPMSPSMMKLIDDNDQMKILYVSDAENKMSEEQTQTNIQSKISASTTSLSQCTMPLTLDMTSPNKILEPIQIASQSQLLTSTSPLSKLAMKSNHDNDSTKNLQDDVTSEKRLLEPMQISVHAQISPSTSPLSQSATEFTHDDDHAKILYVVDDAPKNEMLTSIQTDVHVQNSPSSSPLSQYVVRSTHENEPIIILNESNAVDESEMLEPMHTDGHNKFSTSTTPSSNCTDDYSFSPTTPLFRSIVTYSRDNNQSKIMNVNDTTTENKILKPVQTDGHSRISPSTSPFSKLNIKIPSEKELAINPKVDVEITNKASEPIQTDDHMQVASSTFSLSRSNEKYNYDYGQANDFYIVDSVFKNTMLETPVDSLSKNEVFNSRDESVEKIDDRDYNLSSASPSTLPVSKSSIKLTCNTNPTRNLHMDDVIMVNAVCDPIRNDYQIQVSPSSSRISRSYEKLTHDNDQTKFSYMVDMPSKNEMLEPMQTDGYNEILPSPSYMPPHGVTSTHDNEREKFLYVNDAIVGSETLKVMQNDGDDQKISSTSPVPMPIVKLTHDNDKAPILHLNGATTMKNISELEQIDNFSQISPCTSFLSPSFMTLTHDNSQAKFLYENDTISEDENLELMQNDDYTKVLPSTSHLSQSVLKLTHDDDHTKNVHVHNAATQNEILKPVQIGGHGQISSSTSPLSNSVMKNNLDNDETEYLHLDDVTIKTKMLRPVQIDDHIEIFPPTFSLSPSEERLTNDTNQAEFLYMIDAESKNKQLKLMQIDGNIQNSPSTNSFSQNEVTITQNNEEKILHVNHTTDENEMLQLMQTNDQSQILISPSSQSRSAMRLAHNCDGKQILNMNGTIIEKEMLELMQNDGHDYNREQILHVNDATIEKERLELLQNDGHGQNVPSTSKVFQPTLKPTHEKDQTKSWHVDNIAVETDILEPVRIDDHSQISPSMSSSSQTKMIMKYTHDNDQMKILHLLDVATENNVSELVQTHNHSQSSQHSSSLSQSTEKHTHDNDKTKILHMVDASTTNDMLESNNHSQISASISPLSILNIELTHDDDHAKILHMVEIPENEMLESDQTDGHIQFSHSASHADDDESLESECSDIKDDDIYKDIDGRINKDFEPTGIYDSEDSQYAVVTNDINLENVDFENLNKVDTPIYMHDRNPKKDNQYTSEDKDGMSKFKRENIVDLQNKNDVPEKPEFIQEKVVKNDNGIKKFCENRRLQNREMTDNTNATSPNSIYNDNYYSEDSNYTCGEMDRFMTRSGDVVDISRVDSLKGKHYRNGRSNKQFPPEEDHLVVKRKFRRDITVELESENEVLDILEFRQGRVVEDGDGMEREIGGNTYTADHGFEYIDDYYSEDSKCGCPENEIVEFNSENDDFVNVRRVDIKGKHHRHLKKGKNFNFEGFSPASKCKFRRGRILDMQTQDDIPRWLNFSRGKVIENDIKTYVDRTRLKSREIGDNTNTTSPDSEYTESYYSEDSEYAQSEHEFIPQNEDVASINKADLLQAKHRKNSRKGRQFILQEDSPAYRCKFMKGRIMDLQNDNDVARRLAFRRVRGIENDDDTGTYVRRRKFKNSESVDNVSTTNHDSKKVVLKHQEMHEKKDELCLFNDVIEETVTMLSKNRKSKVKALVGAFETVISLQDRSLARITPH
ncbi:hypothetical protein DCAR_0729163 [Daucus carota subsp. sativus]|uniref:Calmodulin-binding domain-containing protein n=1 Tax=Daucus carota subsp. sativus TaxID=79200 RepID=A0A161ZM05_DAUCS|nr:hypothetical protein DCAR_0729163 [Daucus carota subsp. sativus]